MAGLFDPLTLRGVELSNRIVVSPMSQYAAVDGMANDWHFAHLSRFALGGAGMVIIEATAVSPTARRTPGDLGLWSNAHTEPLERMAAFLSANGSVPAIQLSHAGRKASERRPWHGETPLDSEDQVLRGEGSWRAQAPSPLPYSEAWPDPVEMTEDDIAGVVADFAAAAQRAHDAGIQAVEVYAGHGFLQHQFLSPISNQRTDRYGGDFEGRVRFALETADAIRSVLPDSSPLFFRVSVTDWLDDGWTVEESIELAKQLREVGVDVIDCTSGGIGGDRRVRFPLGEGYQVDLAEQVKHGADIPTMAVGMIWSPAHADEVIQNGQADLVAIGRELLDDPNWPHHAARTLGIDTSHSLWPPESGWWLGKRQRAIDKLNLRPDA